MTSSAPSLIRRSACWAVWFIYLVVTVGLGLEILVRLVMPQVLPVDVPEIFTPDMTIGWRHHPNVRVLANTGDRDVLVCTNVRGDRVSCTGPHRTDCSRRILVVGDSFVEALAVPFEQTAWSKLEQDTGACVDVSGVSGYDPTQYLQMMRERLRDNHQRYALVIASMFVGNDFVTDPERIPPPQSVWKMPFQLLPAGLDANSLYQWMYPFNQWLESRSHAYVALRSVIRNLRDPGNVGNHGMPIVLVRDRLTPAVLDATTRSFSLMAAEADRAGSRFVITIVPIKVQVLDPTGEKLRKAFPALASQLDMNLIEDAFVPRLERIGGVAIVDLLPLFRMQATPDYWGKRDEHLSPRGHEAWFAALQKPVRTALGLQAN